MTLPIWPPALSIPTRESYGYTQPELSLRTPFPQGARLRPLYTDGSDQFDGISVILDGAQCRRLRGFIRYELAYGTKWFRMPLRVDDAMVDLEVRLTAPLTYTLISFGEWRVTLSVETRVGTTMTAEEYADLIDGIGFDDYVQTLLTPSDTAVLLPIEGDAAPAVPVPYLGLYIPDGGVIALEGADGLAVVLDLPPQTWFTGLVPRRLLATGTDAGVVVYGLSHVSVTALPAISGDRVLPIVPSDTTALLMPAVGGLYSVNGGRFSYAADTGDATATIAPRTWWRSTVVTRINESNLDPGFEAVAFVRPLSVPLSPLVFGDGGTPLLFDDYGTPLEFGP